MDWLFGVLVNIATWLVDREKLFSGMPLWGQSWAIRALAKKEPERVAEQARKLFDDELRLAVARGTLENPGAWDRNLSLLVTANLLSIKEKDLMRKIRYDNRNCVTAKEAHEYWCKVKPQMKRLKKITRNTFA